tara:strand:- start:112 stop:564 length:453 start_codon:yes stop_codon:yes gene_type:complete
MFLCILRSPLVYGPGVKGNLNSMRKAIKYNWFPPLPNLSNKRSLIHVDDVVRALIFVTNNQSCNLNIFNITDGKIYTTKDIYVSIANAIGKNIPRYSIPIYFFLILKYIFPKFKSIYNKLFGNEYYSSKKINSVGFIAEKNLGQFDETDF